MNKILLSENLNRICKEINNWLLAHNDDEFEISKRDGKWTTGQHLKHLIKSTLAVNQGLQIPKEMLKAQFESVERSELDFEQLKLKYTEKLAEGPVRAPKSFAPGDIKNADKYDLLQDFETAKQQMLKTVESWSETELSELVLPHPLIGKLTIREMIMFTIYHTEHHLNILKKHH